MGWRIIDDNLLMEWEYFFVLFQWENIDVEFWVTILVIIPLHN